MGVKKRTGDLVSSVIALVVGVAYLVIALSLPIWTEGGNPGAGFLPTLLGVGAIFLSLLLAAKALQEHPSQDQGGGGDGEQGDVRRPLYVLAALVAYVCVFPVLGYVLTSAAFIWFLLWAFDTGVSRPRKAVTATLLSILVVALFYVIFVRLLALQVPVWPLIG